MVSLILSLALLPALPGHRADAPPLVFRSSPGQTVAVRRPTTWVVIDDSPRSSWVIQATEPVLVEVRRSPGIALTNPRGAPVTYLSGTDGSVPSSPSNGIRRWVRLLMPCESSRAE